MTPDQEIRNKALEMSLHLNSMKQTYPNAGDIVAEAIRIENYIKTGK